MQHFVKILNADYKTQQLLFVCELCIYVGLFDCSPFFVIILNNIWCNNFSELKTGKNVNRYEIAFNVLFFFVVSVSKTLQVPNWYGWDCNGRKGKWKWTLWIHIGLWGLKWSCKRILTITALKECWSSIILYYQIIEHYFFKKQEGKNESSLSRNIYWRPLKL